MHLQIILFAFLCSTLTAQNSEDYDLMYVNLENEIEHEILPTEDTPSCDCRAELTEWDKLFVMLENSQMRERMLLQTTDEILKVELQSLRDATTQLLTNSVGACTKVIEKITSQADQMLKGNGEAAQELRMPPELKLGKMLEEVLLVSHNMSNRLSQLENARQRTAEAGAREMTVQKKDRASVESIFSSVLQELQQTRAELQTAKRWAAQHLLPAGCEMAILFPMRSKKIFGSVHPVAEMKLHSFSACTWVKVTEVLNKTILFSYGTKRNPYEIQLYLSSRSAVLTVNGDRNKITAANVTSPGKWTYLCGTWSSKEGSMSLWVNGEMVISTSGMSTDHIIPEGGILQIGQEKNGCCVGGGFDEALAFSGRLTGFNIWDRVLSSEEIKSQTQGEESCNIRGNVVGWGITEIQPHGGAQYVS
ncbi:pentraxin-related protein PTX3 [Tachyglossus aculeatus]|uniref:pentraxin-related protein PTX3 n=1 Tax=Tachyglossus aculeatus TaxID=9261 RepID=UPI0018F4B809|nr:pentraxin-related protein PTX3 [Tachyglossus aculeatus]